MKIPLFGKKKSITVEKDLSVKVSIDALAKMASFTRAARGEIGGLLITEEKDGQVIITDALLLKQRVSAGSVELDMDSLSDFMEELAEEAPEKIAKVKGWWHSHADMETFWSSTDDACFESLLAARNSYVVGIVTNRRGNLKVRVDIKAPIVDKITFDDLPFDLTVSDRDINPAQIKEMKEKVSRGGLIGRLDNVAKKFGHKGKDPEFVCPKCSSHGGKH